MKLNKTAIEAVVSGRIPSAVVGSHKRLVRGLSGDLHGTLHGYSIVTKTSTKLILRHHGIKTAGVRMAMNEFLAAFGVEGRVSFAGNGFKVRIRDQEYEAGDTLEVQL